jgi:hypothetical protein
MKTHKPRGPLDEELDFLWQECDREGNKFDLYLGRISRSPVVRSQATGQYFMLPWSRIIKMATEKEHAQAASAVPLHS